MMCAIDILQNLNTGDRISAMDVDVFVSNVSSMTGTGQRTVSLRLQMLIITVQIYYRKTQTLQ